MFGVCARTTRLLILMAAGCAAATLRPLAVSGPLLNGTSLAVGRSASDTAGTASPDERPVLLFADLKLGVMLKDGRTLTDVVVDDGQLRSGALAGFSFVGALLRGQGSDESEVGLRVMQIDLAPDPRPGTSYNENYDVYLYALLYQIAGAGDWRPLCPGRNQAMVMAGRWDYHRGHPGDGARASTETTEATFACVDSAIARCAMVHGYKPWKSLVTRDGAQISLDPIHRACVRALRADYCGNGDSPPRAGEQVNYHDLIGINEGRDLPGYREEARWGPDGARCVRGTRLGGSARTLKWLRSYLAEFCRQAWHEADPGCSQPPDPEHELLTSYRVEER